MQDQPSALTVDQARLVKTFDIENRDLLDPGDVTDDHLTSEAARWLLDGWDMRDEASK